MFLIPSVTRFLVRNTVIGLNFVDIYYRPRNTARSRSFQRSSVTKPSGVVEAVGPNVTLVQVGDRVAYADAFGCVHDVASSILRIASL